MSLDGLLRAGHDVALVLTQPDRAAGRGLKPLASEVKQLAARRGLAVAQPIALKSPDILEALRSTEAVVMVVVAYGLLLPQAVLDLFPLGCLNVHASLLPRWRGAAPIQRALLAGDAESGVCIMRMEAGLDTGPVFCREAIPIAARETAGTLHDRLAQVGTVALVTVLENLAGGSMQAIAQDTIAVSYAAKVRREDAVVRWAEPAIHLDRVIRAFDPVPGAHAQLGDDRVKVWRAVIEPDITDETTDPGRIVRISDAGLHVACGQGSVLIIQELQREGGRRLPVPAFLRGHPLMAGDQFGDGR